jgi:hypothetical protein
MSVAVTTRAAHIPGTASAARDPTPDSDLSDSADEDKPEVVPNSCLVAMFIGILGRPSVSDLGGGFIHGENPLYEFPIGTKSFYLQARLSNRPKLAGCVRAVFEARSGLVRALVVHP